MSFTRNPDFTGREPEHSVLAELLKHNPVALTQTSAIHGLGGIGKTQLTVEYIFRHQAEYDLVW